MILDIVGWAIYGVGFLFGSRRLMAWNERRVLAKYPKQYKMDADDWIQTGFVSLLGGVAWPLVLMGKWMSKPAYKFYCPPIQKQYDQHVTELRVAKQMALETANVIGELQRAGVHRNRELENILEEQVDNVMRLTNSHRSEESDALQEFKSQVAPMRAIAQHQDEEGTFDAEFVS